MPACAITALCRVALVAFLAAGPTVAAQPVFADDEAEEATRLKEAGEILPLAEILAKAQAVRPGRVIEAELEHEHGRLVYELEILDNAGVVWELSFDAASGALIEQTDEAEP